MSDPDPGAEVSRQVAELIDRVYAAINARDADALAALAQPDFEWRDPPDLAGGGVHKGAEQAIGRMRELDESFEDPWFTQQMIVESGDTILVRTSVSGRGRESGVPTDTEFFSVFHLDDGRIAAQAAFFDRGGAERELRRSG